MLTDIVLRVLVVAALPPPPEPGADPGSGGDQVLPLVALGLVIAAGVALAVGVRSRRSAATRQRRASGASPIYRIEHWRDGEATILAYCDTPSAKEGVLLVHASRLQARGGRGAVVLVEQASDHIAILRPL
ncbi:MAG TPA: hypothetical protein VGR16_10795 [Thermomicrobiales bacterium]|nr:hypothetical protein [Thermomicrobiales bacterium]